SQPEIDANREVDRHRPPVLERRLVLALLDGLDGRIVEHGIRRAEHGHLVDVAFLVDDRLEDDLAFDAGAARDVGIVGIDLLDDDGKDDVAGRQDRLVGAHASDDTADHAPDDAAGDSAGDTTLDAALDPS